MILVDDNIIKVNGSKIILKAELASLFRSFKGNTSITKEDCHEMVDLGFLSDEELHDKFKEEFTTLKKKLEDIRKAINEEEEEEEPKKAEDSDKFDELLDKLFRDIL